MNSEEYSKIGQRLFTGRPAMVSVDELQDKSDRTLLWGYNTARQSWHVYLKDGLIHRYVYGSGLGMGDETLPDGTHQAESKWRAELLIPNKRLYPEACDFEFCMLLIEMRVHLTFTTWEGSRKPKQFHGAIHPSRETPYLGKEGTYPSR